MVHGVRLLYVKEAYNAARDAVDGFQQGEGFRCGTTVPPFPGNALHVGG